MFEIHLRTFVISAILAAFITPGIFGQQHSEPKEEKNAVATERSKNAADEGSAEEKENKYTLNANATRKNVSLRFAPEYKLKLERSTSGMSEQQATQDDPTALAKKLANPISSLISVPFQNNFDFGMGPDKHGFRYTMNFQPVIPFALSKDWNLISRTIVPVIAQHKVADTGTQFGLGDTVQSFFFSPNKSEPFIWGVGPVLLIPTATDKVLGTQKFGIGPTIVVLKQQKQWTVGTLFNHIWSVAGKSSRANVSSTFLQPFVSYTTKTAWTFTVNTESTYDWKAKAWNIPIHLQASKLIKVGKQPISVGGGLRCWAASAPGGPHWCGFRFIFTPLFPKK